LTTILKVSIRCYLSFCWCFGYWNGWNRQCSGVHSPFHAVHSTMMAQSLHMQ
jgi:hypothetical protein